MRLTSLLIPVVAALAAFSLFGETPDPATLKDKVNIILGDKTAVQFHVEGNNLSQLSVVTKPYPKAPTVTFNFSKWDQLLMLVTKNPFPKALSFRALMRFKGRTGYVETNIIPIAAGLSSYESWGDPIEDLMLFDFKLTDQK